MYRLVYTSLLYLLLPILLIRLFWRSFTNKAYRDHFPERFGVYKTPKKPIKVWLHAVSVGETMAAKPLIERLIETHGNQAVLITSTTLTGSHTVRRLFYDRVVQYYFPYDLPLMMDKALQKVNPQVFVSMETEIWPNCWHYCQRMGVPVILANARLSTRSTQRYLKVKTFIGSVLKDATLIACRHQQDKKNFKRLGADPHTVKIVGDIKSDIRLSDENRLKGESFKQQWGDSRPVLVAASTHEGEDSVILDAYSSLKKTHDRLLLVLVPRHPERFPDVACLIDEQGFIRQNRSDNKPFTPQVEVILGDSMGELMAWFVAADSVFMGGSLVDVGGHNPLEPLACGKPVLTGSYCYNFKETYQLLVDRGASIIVEDGDDLTRQVARLLEDKKLSQQMGKNGLLMLEHNSGATERLFEEINDYV